MATEGQKDAWCRVFKVLSNGDFVTQIGAIASLVLLERDLAVEDWKSRFGPVPCPHCGDRHANSPCRTSKETGTA